jgi:hypothetical protein
MDAVPFMESRVKQDSTTRYVSSSLHCIGRAVMKIPKINN